VLPTEPEIAVADRNDMAVAWRWGNPDFFTLARARFKPAGQPFGGEVTVSRADLGPVLGHVSVGGDRVGDFAVAMLQGVEGAKALTVALYDSPPGTPFVAQSSRYQRKTRPQLRWRPGIELWGQQRFRVLVDGAVVGETSDSRLVPSVKLKTGSHKWQVEAIDQAGQVSRSRVRTLKIDATKPRLTVRVSGRRVAGQPLKITASARDSGGSGLSHVTVDYGDRSKKTRERTSTHRYRAGRFTLKVAAVDKAGNVTRKQVKLRIKAS
jgi:hypothetical protein